MTDIVYIRGAKPEAPVERVPNDALVACLKDMLQKAEAGEITGAACVMVYDDGMASYSLVGQVGGFSMVGALHCVTSLLTEINLEDVQND